MIYQLADKPNVWVMDADGLAELLAAINQDHDETKVTP